MERKNPLTSPSMRAGIADERDFDVTDTLNWQTFVNDGRETDDMASEFREGIDLPWGPYGERYTDYEDSFTFLTLDFDAVEIVETTGGGWPAVMVGDRDGTKVGVAIDHVTQLRDKPAEEIDVFVDSDGNWWALVEFADLDEALSGGRYNTQGYDGYERIPCERRTEGFELLVEFADDRVTPIFEMPDDSAAFSIQRASNFGTLHSIFRFETYSTLVERQKTLERQIRSGNE